VPTRDYFSMPIVRDELVALQGVLHAQYPGFLLYKDGTALARKRCEESGWNDVSSHASNFRGIYAKYLTGPINHFIIIATWEKELRCLAGDH